jgi:hypothetical protein
VRFGALSFLLIFFLFGPTKALSVDCHNLNHFWKTRAIVDFNITKYRDGFDCPSNAERMAKALYDLYAVSFLTDGAHGFHPDGEYYALVKKHVKTLMLEDDIVAGQEVRIVYRGGIYPAVESEMAAKADFGVDKKIEFFHPFFSTEENDIFRMEGVVHEMTHVRFGEDSAHVSCTVGRFQTTDTDKNVFCDSTDAVDLAIEGSHARALWVLRTYYHNANYNGLSKALIRARMIDLASNYFNDMTPEKKRAILTEAPLGRF